MVDPTQTAFVPGRLIGDNVLCHLEEVEYLQQTGQPGKALPMYAFKLHTSSYPATGATIGAVLPVQVGSAGQLPNVQAEGGCHMPLAHQ